MRSRLGAALPAALLLFACDGAPTAPPETAFDTGLTLRIARRADTLLIGHQATFSATVTNADGLPVALPLQWETHDLGVLSVGRQSGAVSGAAVGDAWLFVSDGLHLRDSARIAVRVRFRSVLAAGDVSCGLTTDAWAMCWGSNEHGGVGNNGTDDALAPVAVAGGHTFTSLSAGGGTTCGLAGTSLFCWGYNGVGQLGDGTTRSRSAPVRIADSLAMTRVLAGAGATTCGRDDADRTLCWGWNAFNQLLDGTGFNWRTPVVLAVSFTQIASGGGHMCGLDAAGMAWCWGRNDFGQLGDGTLFTRTAPVPVAGGRVFASLVTGREHTCALTAAGALYCWGHNDVAQLASASGVRVVSPTPINPGLAFDTVVTSVNHTCALASGIAYCWGADDYGQAGSGTTSSALQTIQPVAGGHRFATISAGTGHTCGLDSTGIAWCWGSNARGAAGNGSRIDKYVPERVAFQR